LPNETVSTRIWKLHIRLSNHSNKNWRLWLEVGTGVDRIISILEGEYRMERRFVILVLCPF
jgi:hypothetical protein